VTKPTLDTCHHSMRCRLPLCDDLRDSLTTSLLGSLVHFQAQVSNRNFHPGSLAPHRLWYQQLMVTRLAASLRTDNSPQRKERKLDHCLTL
jgi:hypothetical protein